MLLIDQARGRYGVDFDKNSAQILSSLPNCSELPRLPINSASLGLSIVRDPSVKRILEEFEFRPVNICSNLELHISKRNPDYPEDNVFAGGIDLSVIADDILKSAARKVHLRRNYPEVKPKDLLVALASKKGITRTILESYGTQNRLALVYAYTNCL